MARHNVRPGDRVLARRLEAALEGEVRFDALSRGLYSTDASHYQIEPLGVVVPKHTRDIRATIEIATEFSVPVIPRGAGTSQGGQSLGRAVVVDVSKHMRSVLVDKEHRVARVEPGVVLDDLNRVLAPHGLFFPVDVATSNRATIGGMTGNNSSGARSVRYGIMADNVRGVRAVLANGREASFMAEPPGSLDPGTASICETVARIRTVEGAELERRVPRLLRHVAGYNLHRLGTDGARMQQLLVGSEGTLAFFTSIELDLQPLPRHRTLAVCHFSALYGALDAVQHIVELEPSAVELVDGTLIELARAQPLFQPSVEAFVSGHPAALLSVEFEADTPSALQEKLAALDDLLRGRETAGAVFRAETPGLQAQVQRVRKAGLNIVMTMKGERKPVSFIEDCAVPLPRLAEYAERVDRIFRRHGVEGTWYAHASVGCLHVRPALNLKAAADVQRMRAIAEEVHQVVRDLGGSHSGEHGDGIVRSEFIEPMMGSRLTRAFEEVKRTFDPEGRFNPGKIVRPPRMDDREILRYDPSYRALPVATTTDWTGYEGGLLGAVEACNNNGTCLKTDVGVMCPPYRITREERDSTRGRANALRLALSGQLGSEGLAAAELATAMDLCVGCKACMHECPMSIDMTRMKTEYLAERRRLEGTPLRERLFAFLPRYARWVRPLRHVLNARNRHSWLANLAERTLGLAASATLPEWSDSRFRAPASTPASGPEVLVLVDTFARYFDPSNARAAFRVLERAGYAVREAKPRRGRRPLCCGRTFLSAGLVERARKEAERTIAALHDHVDRGGFVVGLEPSCLLTLRDEFPSLVPGAAAEAVARHAYTIAEFLVAERGLGRFDPHFHPVEGGKAVIHSHCHQKALGAATAVREVVGWIPGLECEVIEAGCCGMAGSFGYEAEHRELSEAMAELALAPMVRAAPADAWIVADGTSCRHQLASVAGRSAVHVVELLERATSPP